MARRRSSRVAGSPGKDGLSVDDNNEYRNVLLCGKPVAIVFHHDDLQVNTDINPSEVSDCVVVAEFLPQ